MICSDVYCMHMPIPFLTSLTNGPLDRRALRRTQSNRRMKQFRVIILSPVGVGGDPRSPVDVVVSINRTSLITMQPSAIAPNGEENCQRNVSVVPHKSGSGRMSEPGAVATGFLFHHVALHVRTGSGSDWVLTPQRASKSTATESSPRGDTSDELASTQRPRTQSLPLPVPTQCG